MGPELGIEKMFLSKVENNGGYDEELPFYETMVLRYYYYSGQIS